MQKNNDSIFLKNEKRIDYNKQNEEHGLQI